MDPRVGGDEEEVARARSSAQARDWGLVLSAVGIASRVVQDAHGFALLVPAVDAARAVHELRGYSADVATREAARARQRRWRPPEYPGPAPIGVAVLAHLALAAVYAAVGPAWAGSVWLARGTADAAAIRSGELWRTLTALCLHADLAHLAANLLFGTVFLAALGRVVGPGLALALVLAAGAGGNALNAFLRSADHASIGASTAVFGAVGLLSGVSVVRRAQRGDRWRLTLVPFAAGFGILAMIGSAGERVDVFAHAFGLLVGFGLGLGTARALPRPPGAWAQAVWGTGAVLAMGGSWWLAR